MCSPLRNDLGIAIRPFVSTEHLNVPSKSSSGVGGAGDAQTGSVLDLLIAPIKMLHGKWPMITG